MISPATTETMNLHLNTKRKSEPTFIKSRPRSFIMSYFFLYSPLHIMKHTTSVCVCVSCNHLCLQVFLLRNKRCALSRVHKIAICSRSCRRNNSGPSGEPRSLSRFLKYLNYSSFQRRWIFFWNRIVVTSEFRHYETENHSLKACPRHTAWTSCRLNVSGRRHSITRRDHNEIDRDIVFLSTVQ